MVALPSSLLDSPANRRVRTFLRSAVVAPLARLPTRRNIGWIALAVPYGAAALVLGLSSGLLQPGWPQLWEVAVLAPLLILYPSLIEEVVFRGMLLPPSLDDASTMRRIFAVFVSTSTFVAMHPLNHWLIGLSDTSAFTDPTFLAIVTILGLTCAVQYLKTRSLWVPIATHWATVVAWNLFLGRDLGL